MNKKVTIGRDGSSNIVVSDHERRVSGNHATLHIDGSGRIVFEDHSSNGSIVNGQKIHHASAEIKQGDDIVLGGIIRVSWSKITPYIGKTNRGHEANQQIFPNQPKQKTKPAAFYKMAIITSCIAAAVIIIFLVLRFSLSRDDDSLKDEITGCRIFTTGVFTWDGNCVAGYAHGTGTISWDTGVNYTGELKKGYITGYGTMYYPNSTEIYRRGFFVNGDFQDEENAQDQCRESAHYVVENRFHGGTNIKYDLHSYAVNIERTRWELVFDLEFNGNVRRQNFYKCRVIARHPGQPAFEFVDQYSNSSVRNYLGGTLFVETMIDFIFK